MSREQTLSEMNEALCRFGMRWKLDGDYLRCVDCDRPHIASRLDLPFRHADGCAFGESTDNPWRTFLQVLGPLAALSQPQAASSTQAVEYSHDQIGGGQWTISASDRGTWLYNFGHGQDAEILARGIARLMNAEVRHLASSTTPGSTGAVDALPAKWREAADRLAHPDHWPNQLRWARAETYRSCADQLEAALAQPAQQGDQQGSENINALALDRIKTLLPDPADRAAVEQAASDLRVLWRDYLRRESSTQAAPEGGCGEAGHDEGRCGNAACITSTQGQPAAQGLPEPFAYVSPLQGYTSAANSTYFRSLIESHRNGSPRWPKDAVLLYTQPAAQGGGQREVNYFWACDVAAKFDLDYNRFSAALRDYLKGPGEPAAPASGDGVASVDRVDHAIALATIESLRLRLGGCESALADRDAKLAALSSPTGVDEAMRKRTREWLAANGGFWDDAYVDRLLHAALAAQDGGAGNG